MSRMSVTRCGMVGFLWAWILLGGMFREPVFVKYVSTTFHAFSCIFCHLHNSVGRYGNSRSLVSVASDTNALIHLINVVEENT